MKNTTSTDINSDARCVYNSTMTIYSEVLTKANSMKYFYTHLRKGILSNLVRSIICGADTKEALKMNKKSSACLQKCLLYGLTREFAVDILPAIARIIALEKKNFGSYDSGSAVASRGGRETRRSLVTMVQMYPYLSRVFPYISDLDNIMNFIHRAFSLSVHLK